MHPQVPRAISNASLSPLIGPGLSTELVQPGCTLKVLLMLAIESSPRTICTPSHASGSSQPFLRLSTCRRQSPPPSVLKMLLALYQTAIGALLDRFSGERGRPPDPYAGDGQRTLRRPRPQRTKASESQNPPIVLYHRHKRKNQSGNPFYFNRLERKPGD
jgi:hypothetical protein